MTMTKTNRQSVPGFQLTPVSHSRGAVQDVPFWDVPFCEFWGPKLQSNRRRDEENVRKLRNGGWKVCVVWECETKNAGKLFTRLSRFLAGTHN
jgi:G:T-mismatch repair DNA endonuclease (very short patch repair protein)